MKKTIRGEISFIVIACVVLAIAVFAYFFGQKLGFLASTNYTELAESDTQTKYTFSVDKSSAVADGQDTITLTTGVYLTSKLENYKNCSGTVIFSKQPGSFPGPYCFHMTTRDRYGQTLGTDVVGYMVVGAWGEGLSFDENYETNPSDDGSTLIYAGKFIDCKTGKFSIKLKSTSAGTKRVGIAFYRESASYKDGKIETVTGNQKAKNFILSLDVTFTAPPGVENPVVDNPNVELPTPAPSTGSGSTQTPTAPSVSIPDPATDQNTTSSSASSSSSGSSSSSTNSNKSLSSSTGSKIKTNAEATTATGQTPTISSVSTSNLNQTVNSGSVGSPVVYYGEPITFSGKADPNVTVNLFIYSDPIKVTTTSDADGNWSYTYSDPLPIGDHIVDIQTVASDGATSDQITFANFSVMEKPAESKTDNLNNSEFWFPLAIGAGALIIAIVSIIFIRKRKRKSFVNLAE